MEPELSVGSVALTSPTQPQAIDKGDIISFYSPLNGQLTSHRVVDITASSSLQFRTKGDSNEDVDPFTVPEENIVGKVLFDLPFLGYVTHFARTRLGFILMIGVPGALIIAHEMLKIWRVLTIEEKRKASTEAG